MPEHICETAYGPRAFPSGRPFVMIPRLMDRPARTCLWTLGLWVSSLATGVADGRPLRELRSIREVRALTPQEAALGYPVFLRATVTHLNEERFSVMTLHDGTLGQFVITAEGS